VNRGRVDGSLSIAPDTKLVTVLNVLGTKANVTDRNGNKHDIPIDTLRYKGDPPAPGEIWYIDRYLGGYTFVAIVGYMAPRVSAAAVAALEAIDLSAVADTATRTALEAIREALTG
jgi:hypothetical protein